MTILQIEILRGLEFILDGIHTQLKLAKLSKGTTDEIVKQLWNFGTSLERVHGNIIIKSECELWKHADIRMASVDP